MEHGAFFLSIRLIYEATTHLVKVLATLPLLAGHRSYVLQFHSELFSLLFMLDARCCTVLVIRGWCLYVLSNTLVRYFRDFACHVRQSNFGHSRAR